MFSLIQDVAWNQSSELIWLWVAPTRIVGLIRPGILLQASPDGYTIGTRTNPIITIQKINFIATLRFCNIFCNNIVNPIEPKMIRANEANNSSLINAELTYNPQSPKTNANTFISFCMEWFEFFALSENSNHAPINPNIINTESPAYNSVIVVAVCSATEVVNASVEPRNGLTAFRYLNDGAPNPDERTAIPDATNMPNTPIEFRILVVELLNFWTIKTATKKIVGNKTRNPLIVICNVPVIGPM